MPYTSRRGPQASMQRRLRGFGGLQTQMAGEGLPQEGLRQKSKWAGHEGSCYLRWLRRCEACVRCRIGLGGGLWGVRGFWGLAVLGKSLAQEGGLSPACKAKRGQEEQGNTKRHLLLEGNMWVRVAGEGKPLGAAGIFFSPRYFLKPARHFLGQETNYTASDLSKVRYCSVLLEGSQSVRHQSYLRVARVCETNHT